MYVKRMLARAKKLLLATGNTVVWAGAKAGLAILLAGSWAAIVEKIFTVDHRTLWLITIGFGTLCYSVLRYEPPLPPDPYEIEKRTQRREMLDKWESWLSPANFESNYERRVENSAYAEMTALIEHDRWKEIMEEVRRAEYEPEIPSPANVFRYQVHQEIHRLRQEWDLI